VRIPIEADRHSGVKATPPFQSKPSALLTLRAGSRGQVLHCHILLTSRPLQRQICPQALGQSRAASIHLRKSLRGQVLRCHIFLTPHPDQCKNRPPALARYRTTSIPIQSAIDFRPFPLSFRKTLSPQSPRIYATSQG
jgi:hypothetical protein